MMLKNQKRIASQLLKVGQNKVWFDPRRLKDIKEAITKADIRSLINDFTIQAKPMKGVSRFRARKIKIQKRKHRRKGEGSRKGKQTIHSYNKSTWVKAIRVQRNFLKELKKKNLINNQIYNDLYRKSKGGFFRSKRHIKLYLEERKLIDKK